MTKNIWPKSFNVAGTDLIPVKVKPSYKPHSVYLVKRSKLLDSKLWILKLDCKTGKDNEQ